MAKRFSIGSPALVDLAIVLLTLFAPAFAATNQLAGKAVLILGAGLLWLLAPPTHVDWRKLALAGGIVLIAWAALLPASWFATPAWRETLTQAGATLPGTFTPQPWLTFEHSLLLAGGLLWALYLVSRTWLVERQTLLGIYAAGMAVLAALWLVQSGARTGAGQFGFFLNRNQSAHVLAVAGVVMLGLALNGWREHRPTALAWLAPLMIVIVALLRAGSRAGILLFMLGSGFWLLLSGRLGLRLRWLPIAASAAMLFAAIVLLFGERIIARLPVGDGTKEISGDLRVRIWSDTLPFIRDGSWHGHGLGNFSPLFARYRSASANPDRAIHPESDWFWVASELGWIAVPALLFLIGWLIRGCFPMAQGTSRLLRSTALVAAGLTLLHGFVDVSGHRVGSLWPSLFLLGIATWAPPQHGSSPAWRWLGVPFVLIGLVWLVAGMGLVTWPSTARHTQLVQTTRDALRNRQYPAALAAGEAGLQLNPANWEFWYARAAARAATVSATGNARKDFAVARWLEPNAKVAFEEGRAWLIREGSTNEWEVWFGPEPRLAAEAWRAGLAMDPRTFPGLFSNMISTAREHPEAAPYVSELAGNDPSQLIEVLIGLPTLPFDPITTRLLAVDPLLGRVEPGRRGILFREWFRRGDRARLEQFLETHPEWLSETWPVYGDVLAARGDFQSACGLALKYLPAMEIPVIEDKPIARARADHLSNPRDVVAGLAYLQALLKQGDVKEAARILPNITISHETPAHVHAIAARFWLQQSNTVAAWSSFRRAAGN